MRYLFSTLIYFFLLSSLHSQTIKVKGRVIDGKSIEPLAAIIRVIETKTGTACNSEGYYELNLKPGSYNIQAKYYGYKTSSSFIVIHENDSEIEFNFFLFGYSSSTIVVSADREKTKQPSTFYIEPDIVKHYPATAEYDILRTFTLLPGINQSNNLKSVFYVRGGSSDQNQLLLDGIEIYNPSHLLGLFSAFNFYTIQSATVYTANFPVENAHRLSSVVSMQSKQPKEKEEFHGNVGVFSTSLFYSRKFGNFGFVTAGRITYLDLLMKLIYNVDLPYQFFDTFAKATYDFSQKVSADIVNLISQDFSTPFSSTAISKRYTGFNTWGNRMVGIHLRYNDENSKHVLTTSYINSFKEFSGQSLVDSFYKGFMNLQLHDATTRYDGSIDFKRIIFKWGVEYKFLQTDYKWNTEALAGNDEFFYVGFPLIYSERNDMNLISGYLGVVWDISEYWLLQTSFRYSYSVNRSSAYIPRLAFIWKPFDKLKFSASTQLSSQFIAEGQEGYRITIGNPVFILDKPIEALIGTFGVSYKLPLDINISCEGYFKYYTRNIELQRVRPLVSDLYPIFREGTGYSYGFDFFIDRFVDEGLFFQFAYSFQRTLLTLTNIDLYEDHQAWVQKGNITFPSSWMIEHALKGSIGYRHSESGWIGSVGATFNLGRPVTPQIAAFEANRSLEDILIRTKNPSITESIDSPLLPSFRTIPGDPNSISLPFYLIIDVSLKKEFRTAVNKWTVYIQIKNILNRNGSTYYDWESYYRDGNGKGTVERLIATSQVGLPIFPSLGVECEF